MVLVRRIWLNIKILHTSNVRLIQDVMFFTEYTKTPGIAIFLDFRKAFDTIEWPYLKAAL